MERVARPTTRQVYALAAALCERAGEEWPESRDLASELIERIRIETGHPAPRREDTPLRPRRARRDRTERLASAIARHLAEELR
jgi:hypothetical protein